jgi:hypothetical protein
MSETNDLDLDAIEARVKAATPGPLRVIRMKPLPTVSFNTTGGRAPCGASADDLVHAAIRAGLAAKAHTRCSPRGGG